MSDSEHHQLGPQMIEAIITAAEAQADADRFQEAEAMLRPVAAYSIRAKQRLAVIYDIWGQLNDAVLLQQEAIEGNQQTLGFGHPDTVRSVHDLTTLYARHGRFNDAAELQLRLVHFYQNTLGPIHADTLAANEDLNETYIRQGNLPLALESSRYILQMRLNQSNDEVSTNRARNNLATVLYQLGHYDAAERLLLDALEYNQNQCDKLLPMGNLILLLQLQGRFDEAIDVLKDVLELPDLVFTSNKVTRESYRSALVDCQLALGIIDSSDDGRQTETDSSWSTIEIIRRTSSGGITVDEPEVAAGPVYRLICSSTNRPRVNANGEETRSARQTTASPLSVDDSGAAMPRRPQSNP